MRCVSVGVFAAWVALGVAPLTACAPYHELAEARVKAQQDVDAALDRQRNEQWAYLADHPAPPSTQLSQAEIEAYGLGFLQNAFVIYCRFPPDVASARELAERLELKTSTVADLQLSYADGIKRSADVAYFTKPDRGECGERKRRYAKIFKKLAANLQILKGMGY